MTSSAITTLGLTKDYGAGHGIFDLDLEVGHGEIFGFLGPNGSGKSTAMRVLMGLISPTSGSAALLGEDVVRTGPALHRRIGYLAGDWGLYPTLTGTAALRYLARVRGGVDPDRVHALATRFGAQLDRPLRELSTGNRQKIGLIQAFMHDPELLILDEPTRGLDPLVQNHFHALLHEARDAGRTVFLSSHTLTEVERVADHVGVLREGRLVVVDTLEHLRAEAVSSIDVTFVGDVDLQVLERVENVRSAVGVAGAVRIEFKGSADALLKALAGHEVTSLRPGAEDLESILLKYYAGDEQGT
jgi:ABC-2 type transport system ATP-binding protein